ncbi:MAG: hypothetical protein ACXVW5_22010 [Solirubrobacteraceae bacterium]
MGNANASTIAERQAQSEHVLYEIEMLCKLAAYFETGEVDRAVRYLDQSGIVVRNAVIEAFQLHARQLLDFFRPCKQDPRDSYAWHFTTAPWTLKRTAAQAAEFDRFSKRVMHLTLRRATFTDAGRRVDTRRIRRMLGADIERFLKAVDQQRVCNDFVSRARAALLSSEPPPESPLTPPVGATDADPYTVRATGVLYTGGTAVMM